MIQIRQADVELLIISIRFYAAEVIVALEYLHCQGRDLFTYVIILYMYWEVIQFAKYVDCGLVLLYLARCILILYTGEREMYRERSQ